MSPCCMLSVMLDIASIPVHLCPGISAEPATFISMLLRCSFIAAFRCSSSPLHAVVLQFYTVLWPSIFSSQNKGYVISLILHSVLNYCSYRQIVPFLTHFSIYRLSLTFIILSHCFRFVESLSYRFRVMLSNRVYISFHGYVSGQDIILEKISLI